MNYKAIKINGKKKDLHRCLMERKLGRKLDYNEVVHHKDENKLNNDINNLEVKERSFHTSEHLKGRIVSNETKRKLSIKNKGTLPINCKKIQKISKSGVKTDIYNSAREAARALGNEKYNSHIVECCNKKRKTAYGYKWEWVTF